MLLITLNRRCIKHQAAIKVFRSSSSAVTTSQNAETEAVTYPPIEDISFPAKFRRFQDAKHKAVQSVSTIEEKHIKLNMPRFWGFRTIMYEEGKLFYNELPHAQYVTRTHVVSESKLPKVYDNIMNNEKLDGLVGEIKEFFENGIAFEFTARNRSQEYSEDTKKDPSKQEDIISDAIARQTNRLLMSSLSKHCPHLIETDVQYDPRIEAFWFAGGIYLHKGIIQGRERKKWNEVLDEPADRPLQYLGNPGLQLRYKLPLREIIPLSECENPEFEVPIYKHDPRCIGHYLQRRHGTSIPGYWPGDVNEFGLLSYHKRGYMLINNRISDEVDALKAQALYASWAWLLGQACNQGFSTYNDVTYPLVNQAVITNGQWWSFSVYQLNTTLVNNWYNDTNPKRNIMWMTEPMKLFERIEDGKLVGVNDEVLKTLIKFYANAPEERVGVDMKPYTGHNERLIADIEDDERRNWLEKRFKHMMSNRPRHRLAPERYHWQWIYKDLFQTRPLDKRRTHWDFGLNPYLRRLNEHTPEYIPKKLRNEKARRVKWAKTYYP